MSTTKGHTELPTLDAITRTYRCTPRKVHSPTEDERIADLITRHYAHVAHHLNEVLVPCEGKGEALMRLEEAWVCAMAEVLGVDWVMESEKEVV